MPSSLFQDLRYAIRRLHHSPGFTLVAVLTLGLGIGANTAVFSVVNTVLLRPLPYTHPERLTLIWTNFGIDLPQNWLSGPEFEELREFNTVFQEVGVVVPTTASLIGAGEPEQLNVAAASGTFFSVLDVEPQLGRVMTEADDHGAAEKVAVLTDGFWKRRFGADPDVIGTTLNLDGQVFTVIGVLPRDFEILHPDAQFPKSVDVWVPLVPLYGALYGLNDYSEAPRSSHGLRGFGRLKPGITLARAQADMDAVARAMQEKSPDYYDFPGWGLTVLSLHDDLVEDVKPALLVLLGAVGFVLLIACVNVANLMLVRAAGREREIAVRSALGAGRRRLTRQLLTESVTLGVAGGAFGLALAFALVRAVTAFAPANLPRGDEIGLDIGVLLFTLIVSLLTGLVFGVLPALYARREDLVESLKEGARGATAGMKGRRARTGLVVAEVALALVLLAGAGLMVRSFNRLLASDLGYNPRNVLTLHVPLSMSTSSQRAISFWDQLLSRTTALPGVTSAGAISQLPLSGSAMSGTTRIENSETVPEDQRAWEVDRRAVSPDYFRTMGVPILRGRPFSEADNGAAPPVAIVDETFVRHFWPGEDPIGQRIAINRDSNGELLWREVVGVVAHARHNNVATVGREQAYFPYNQYPQARMYLAARAAVEPLSLARPVQREVWSLDPNQPVADVQTMEARVAAALSQPRFALLLFGSFAFLALVMAAVGVYGVISYTVSQRSHEIGIRMAVGADRRSVVSHVMRQGMALVAAGLIIGAAAALALTRLLGSLLYEVSASDPLTYAAGILLLAVVAALACGVPALRAARLQPVEVLRRE
ncbi:MAG: ABC transporter permease [Gemmatimonadales bacterium]|jgi:putative ABC transport system permease protein